MSGFSKGGRRAQRRCGLTLRSLGAIVMTIQVGLPQGRLTAEIIGRPKPTARLEGDARLLAVLDRFTYGPRPGDLARIRSIGMQAWFNQQLDPQRIDDSALEARLDTFPAMRADLRTLMLDYPSQQVVRKTIIGGLSRPSGLAEQAIYAGVISRYQDKLGGVQAKPAQPLPFAADALLAMPPDARFAAICRLTPAQRKSLSDALGPANLARLGEGMSPLELEEMAALNNPLAVVAAEDVQTKLLRDIYSERQLNEVMTDFWLNHFNVYMRKSQDAPYYIAAYARETVRPRALGSFEDLLVAAAMSPAMLNYLDDASSVGPDSAFAHRPQGGGGKRAVGLNENYARELMELHTVGVDGGYTQRDVTELAKVFTGWGIGPQGRGQLPVRVGFDESRHEPGTKTVMGVKIKESGAKEGLDVLHRLATSPKTAQFISMKLAVRFVADDPPPAMVDRMTKTFLATGGNIRQVLLAMVNSPEFFELDLAKAKVKTPVDFVVSAVRASDAEVASAGALADVIATLGMPVYGMQTPNGYSMKAEPWNNTASLIARLNFSLALATNRVMGVTTDWDAALGEDADADRQTKESRLEEMLLHGPASAKTRDAVLTQMTENPDAQQASVRQVGVERRGRDPLAIDRDGPPGKASPADLEAAFAAGLLLGSPEFQRR